MMRLIDADVMRADWLENGQNEYVYDTNAVLDSIDEQPTIDAVPVVHSHWVNCEGHTFAPVGARCFCYNCHFYDSEPYNWCHGCGAKMDGGADEK